jgi:hypothetical protein
MANHTEFGRTFNEARQNQGFTSQAQLGLPDGQALGMISGYAGDATDADLLAAAKASDAAFTWLAEQMNSITDNAKHWNTAQIEAIAQDLRIGIERNQRIVRTAILKASTKGGAL